MPWLFTNDEVHDRKLRVAYESCINVALLPFSQGDGYENFQNDVKTNLVGHPFYTNLSSVEEVLLVSGLLSFIFSIFWQTT